MADKRTENGSKAIPRQGFGKTFFLLGGKQRLKEGFVTTTASENDAVDDVIQFIVTTFA